MAKWEQDILMVMENRGKKYNNEPVSICTVKNLDPFVIEYQGISVGKIFGDEIYMEGKFDPLCRKGMEWGSEKFASKEHALIKEILKAKNL